MGLGAWIVAVDRAVGEDDRGPPACSDLLSCLARARRTSPEKKDGASSAARLQPPSHLLVDADLLIDLGKRLVGPTCCRIAMEERSDGAAPLPVEEAACSALPTAAGEDGFLGQPWLPHVAAPSGRLDLPSAAMERLPADRRSSPPGSGSRRRPRGRRTPPLLLGKKPQSKVMEHRIGAPAVHGRWCTCISVFL
ncbi:hypothetical protein ACLOJK_005928 [Asimina triloba]